MATRCQNFDELVTEIWCLCADSQWLRASPAYQRLREWLGTLSSTCPRTEADLKKVQCVLRALRACDQTCLDELLRDERCPPAPVKWRRPRDELARRVAAANHTADYKLFAALNSVDGCVGLQRFFHEVAVHTCDQGALLMRVTGNVLADFRSFVDSLFSNRVTQIGMVLAREQMSMRERYAALEGRTLNRAQLALTHIRYVMPTFVWQRYVTEPGYITTVVPSVCREEDMHTNDPDVDDIRGKSLLYQLNWLRSEIDRTECENQGLLRQRENFIVELAEINRKIANAQCKAANVMASKVAELNELKTKSNEQVCVIDKLMEAIELAIQNSKSVPGRGH